MKVVHIINSLQAGGAERLLSELLPAMREKKQGLEIEVLVLDARNDAFSEGIEAAGIRVIFARPGGASPYSPVRLLDIARIIRRSRPDIVHSHLGPSFHWTAMLSLVYRRAKYLTTEHASENRRMSMPFIKPLERFCYSRYSRIICVSEDTRIAISAWLGGGNTRLTVVANGIPLKRFLRQGEKAEDIASWLGGRRGIAITARLVPAKDHATALRALAMLPENYALVCIGDGPEKPSLVRLSQSLGLEGRCLFAGARLDVPEVLRSCELYLQTSKKEGFGIAALEAMAMGLPVVASDSPGLGALVRDAGLLFSVGNANECAAALEKIGKAPTLAEQLREAGFAKAREYAIDTCAMAYLNIYQQFLPSFTVVEST